MSPIARRTANWSRGSATSPSTASPRGDAAAYPTLCKGASSAGDVTGHIFEDPSSLDAATLIPQLADAGVTALKIEGRQRSRAYTEAVVRAFRKARGRIRGGPPGRRQRPARLTEGADHDRGAYRKTWR